MRKLAFEHAGVGGFEMPKLRMVTLEKENSNLVLANIPGTVWKGNASSGYSRQTLLRLALAEELGDLGLSWKKD